jgi:hypothetical protein
MSFSLGLYKQSPNEKERPKAEVQLFTLDGYFVLEAVIPGHISGRQPSTQASPLAFPDAKN